MRVSKNCLGQYRKKVECVCVPKNGRFRGTSGKRYYPCEYRKTIPASTGNGSNVCEYRKRVESGRVPGKGRIRASIEKLSRRVSERVESVTVSKNGRIRASTEKRKNGYEYGKTVPTSTGKRSNLCEYRKMVEYGRLPGKGRIPVSIEKMF